MAKHFKTVDPFDEGKRPNDAIPNTPSFEDEFAQTPVPISSPETRASVTGSDYVTREHVYRQPVENTPTSSELSFVPVVSSGDVDSRNKRRRDSAYAETDPYDLAGVREGKAHHHIIRGLSTVLFLVGVVLLLVALGMWGKTQWDYHQQDVAIAKLQGYAHLSEDTSVPPEIDWSALKAVNADVVGWVQIPGTVVNYPVYYGESNDEYLRTNAEGEYAVGGEVFLDYLNTAPGMIDMQSIIYGHHLYNGTMFKPIADMDNQELFDSISTVWYVTEGQTFELEPLFLYYTDPYDENARTFAFSSPEEFRAYLSGILSAKGVTKRADAETIIAGTNHVLTLATCNYYDNYGRSLLVCVPKSEAGAAQSAN